MQVGCFQSQSFQDGEVKMICCYRYPEGISLNGREYMLDGDEIALFETEQELFDFINDNVIGSVVVETAQDLTDSGIYIEEAHQTDEYFSTGIIQ